MPYDPKTPPANAELLSPYVAQEFREISAIIRDGELDMISFAPQAVAPPKPRVGLTFYGLLDVGVVGAEGLRVYKSTGWALV